VTGAPCPRSGEIHFEDGQEQFHARAADVKIFHRRNADNRRRIHRVLAMRDGDGENIWAGISATAPARER
jgi:hypothetical protein